MRAPAYKLHAFEAFPKSKKGCPKSRLLFRQPFDRPYLRPILLIINFTVRTATHAVLAVRCDKDAGRDCGSDNA